MPKIVDKAAMREKILEATVQAFAKHGFYKTTMDLIAKEAGIAKGTLYLYFNSKETLSIAFVESYFAKMEHWLTQQKKAQTLDAFIKQLEHSLLIDEKQAKFIPVFFQSFGPSFHSPAFRQSMAASFDRIGKFYADTLTHLQKNAEVQRSLNPKAYGRVFVSMLDGVMLHYGLFAQEEDAYKKMVAEMLTVVKNGLSP